MQQKITGFVVSIPALLKIAQISSLDFMVPSLSRSVELGTLFEPSMLPFSNTSAGLPSQIYAFPPMEVRIASY